MVGGDSLAESEHLHSRCLLGKRGRARLGVRGGLEGCVAHALSREEVGSASAFCDLRPMDASRALWREDASHALREVEPEDLAGRWGESIGRHLRFRLPAREWWEFVHPPPEELLEKGAKLRPLVVELGAGELLAVAVAAGLVGLLCRDEEVSSLRDHGHLPDAELRREHLEQPDVVVRILGVLCSLERGLDLDPRPVHLVAVMGFIGDVLAGDDVFLSIHGKAVDLLAAIDAHVEHCLVIRELSHVAVFLFDGLAIEEDGDAIDIFH